MTIVPYNQESANNDYQDASAQIGGMNVFRGGRYQKGYGIGNILSSLFKSAVPLLKKGAMSLGKTALQTGLNVAKDAFQGRDIKSSLRENAQKAGRQVAAKALNQIGQIPQNLIGGKNSHVTSSLSQSIQNKNKKRKGSSITSPSKAKRRRRNKRRAADIFT